MLAGAEAFGEIRELLDGVVKQDAAQAFAEPALARLRDTLCDPSATALDRAVLLRQVLLYESARRGSTWRAAVTVPRDWQVAWDDVGLEAVGGWLSAIPWTPTWLADARTSVDTWAASEVQRRLGDEGVDGDPFLATVGYRTYRTRGQRAAARAVLTTPPGEMLAVVLATGEGKSLLFRVIDTVGFAGDESDGRRGVTLVVVPTVSLALDHAASVGDGVPRAWQSGGAGNVTIAQAVRAGTQGLCFASPEAVCGPLRESLLEAARNGTLRAIVIDEAHMVDAWGTGFRTEYQTLGGVQYELRQAAPPAKRPRTICLSATLSVAARETLAALFHYTDFKIVSAARLRPEPEYWFSAFTSEDERGRRVLEALKRVPRPAILYVTRVDHADRWGARLRAAGFGRLRVVHSRTSAPERESTLHAWRAGAIDLVVATSAFGLGIDYPHVRSIIHACVPETLDRYYQEVGRGGRDGRASLSLVLPASNDRWVAQKINRVVVIGVDRGMQRWNAMFDGPKISLGPDQFALRLDVAPGTDEADIAMVGERNTDWNARTLTLLARARIVRLLGRAAPLPPNSVAGVWQAVEILDHEHRKIETWERCVEPVRQRVASANARSLGLMRRLLDAPARCPASVFVEIYADSAPVCSRCEECRAGGVRWPFAEEREFRSPWPVAALREPVRSLIDHGNRLVVKLEDDGPLARRRLGDVLLRLVRAGMRNVVVFGEAHAGVDEALARLAAEPAFVARGAPPGLAPLPPGPAIVIVTDGGHLSPVHLASRLPGDERVIFVPAATRSPVRPDLPVSEIHDGRVMTISQFRDGTLT